MFGKAKRCMSMILLVAVMGLAVGAKPAFADEDAGGRKIKSKVSPLYPELAKKMNLSGTVRVEVVVGPNGLVKSTKVVGGHPVLAESAVDAVKRWKYEPGSAETTTTVEFHFNNNQ